LKKVILISGRYIEHNPYRELVIFDKLKVDGNKPLLFLPTLNYKRGYPNEVLNDPIFKKYSPKTFSNSLSLLLQTIGSKYYIIGSDYFYNSTGLLLRIFKKKIISYDSAGGMDHKQNFANITCIKSKYYSKYIKTIEYGWAKYLYKSKLINKILKLDPQNSHKISGSILYENRQKVLSANNDLKKRYNINDIIIFFPKSIITYHEKLNLWFKDEKNKDLINSFSKKHKDLCFQIIRKLIECRFDIVVKLHPSIYNSNKIKFAEEKDFWVGAGAKIMNPEDSFSFYNNLDLGISLNSHSCMDVNYFRKPFLFIKDGQSLPSLDAPSWQFHKYTSLPLGPIKDWGKKIADPVNKFFPTWIGYFSDINSLTSEKISSYIENPIDQAYYDKFIEEFWYKDDNSASQRIVNQLKNLS